ncbi:MAG: hypothetical protein WC916_05195 [Candidatus Woesearchaeota archaeon]
MSMTLFFKGWLAGMKEFGGVIAAIVNFILLFPVYIIGVGVTSLVAKIFGKHFLNLKNPDKKLETYWLQKEGKKSSKEDCYRQF